MTTTPADRIAALEAIAIEMRDAPDGLTDTSDLLYTLKYLQAFSVPTALKLLAVARATKEFMSTDESYQAYFALRRALAALTDTTQQETGDAG